MLPERSRFRRFLERHLQIDLGYLASGGFWLASDQIAGALASFLLTIAFAHFVPKNAYGIYRYLLAAFWTLTAFTLTGLPTAVSQAVARGEEGTFCAALGWSLRGGLLLGLIAVGGSAYYFSLGSTTLAIGFLAIAILGPLMQAAYLFGSYLIGKKVFQTVAITGAVFAAVPATLLLPTMFLTKSSAIFIAVYLAGNVLTGFALTLWTFVHYHPNASVDPSFKSLGLHFSAMNLLSTLAAQIDKLVVFHFLGAVDLAVYALATAMPEQLRNILGSAATLALPKFVEHSFGDIMRTFWARLFLYTVGIAIIALLYILLAPLAFSIFFPSYREAIPYSELYVFALIPIGSALPITLLQAEEAKRELYLFNILSPIISITALLVLTAGFGLVGTIVARIVGRATGLALSALFVLIYEKRITASGMQ